MTERIARTEAENAHLARAHTLVRGLWRAAPCLLLAWSSALCLNAAPTGQQDAIVVRYLGTSDAAAQPSASGSAPGSDAIPMIAHTTATPSKPVIQFNPAAVGIAEATAQKLTATFTVSGYTGTFIPSAVLHYGLSYTLGTVGCAPADGSETCTVPITFRPQYPGARRDALFLMNGSARLATVLLSGVGQGPMALVQPGNVVNQVNGSNSYFFGSVTDEEGTVWSISGNAPMLTEATKAGVLTEIPLSANSQQAIAIDGAGVLYINQANAVVTYDTVQKVFGKFPLPSPTDDLMAMGVGNAGNIYVAEDNIFSEVNTLYTVQPNGTTKSAVLPEDSRGYSNSPTSIVVDENENLFFGGYWTINEVTAAGVQTEINTKNSKAGIAVDPAETVYAGNYGGYTITELAAADYAIPFFVLYDGGAFGVSMGPDGTVNVGNYFSLLQLIRSKGSLSFGGSVGVASAPQTAGIYNGGNKPLTLSEVRSTGTAFALQPSGADECKAGLVLAPGVACQVAVTYTAPHPGSFTGAVNFTTNTLNSASAVTSVALSATANGVYLVPSPGQLSFSPQSINTASSPKTVTVTDAGYYTSTILEPPTSSNPAFTVSTGTCTGQLTPGASCQLTVTFTPTAAQAYSGTVTLPCTGSSTATINVSGTGSGPPLTLNIAEAIHVSDGAPVVSPATVLAIKEGIHVLDCTPVLTPATVLAIPEVLHVSDGGPVLTPATVLPINETIHTSDSDHL